MTATMNRCNTTNAQIPFNIRAVKMRLTFLTSVLVMFLSSNPPTDAQPWPLSSLEQATDVTMTLYPENGVNPLAVIQVGHLYVDYERRGFFRIGLLPIPVAENVQIRIESADCLTNAILTLRSWNQPSVGARRFALRNIDIGLLDDKQPRLSAASAHIGPDGTLELTKVSLFNASGQPKSIPKAILQVSGSAAGWLRWNVDGQPQNAFLFKPITIKTP